MFQSVLKTILNSTLGKFLQIGEINIGLSGLVELRDVELNAKTIETFLPIAIKLGRIGHLKIQLSWLGLLSTPVKVEVRDVYAVVALPKDSDVNLAEINAQILQQKLEALLSWELLNFPEKEVESDKGTLMKTIDTVIDHVTVTVERVHVVFEEQGINAGLVLGGAKVYPIDENGTQLTTCADSSTVGRRKIEVSDFGLYFNIDPQEAARGAALHQLEREQKQNVGKTPDLDALYGTSKQTSSLDEYNRRRGVQNDPYQSLLDAANAKPEHSKVGFRDVNLAFLTSIWADLQDPKWAWMLPPLSVGVNFNMWKGTLEKLQMMTPPRPSMEAIVDISAISLSITKQQYQGILTLLAQFVNNPATLAMLKAQTSKNVDELLLKHGDVNDERRLAIIDKGVEYVQLYKRNFQGYAQLEQKDFDTLKAIETSQPLTQILTWRSIALKTVQIEYEQDEKPFWRPKPSGFLSSWFGGGSSGPKPPHKSVDISLLKSYIIDYAAIQHEEEKKALKNVKSHYVKIFAAVKLAEVTMNLVQPDRSKIVSFGVFELGTQVKLYPNSIGVECSIDRLEATDHLTKDAIVRSFIRKSQSELVKDQPFVTANVVVGDKHLNPETGYDIAVRAKVTGVDVFVNIPLLLGLATFFVPPKHFTIASRAKNEILTEFSSIQSSIQSNAITTLESRGRQMLDVQIAAPTIIIPTDVKNAKSHNLVTTLGELKIKATPPTLDAVKQQKILIAKAYSDNSVLTQLSREEQKSLFYDTFEMSLSNVSVYIGDPKYLYKPDDSVYLVRPMQIDLAVSLSLLASTPPALENVKNAGKSHDKDRDDAEKDKEKDPNQLDREALKAKKLDLVIPQMLVHLSLPSIDVQISPLKIGRLLRLTKSLLNALKLSTKEAEETSHKIVIEEIIDEDFNNAQQVVEFDTSTVASQPNPDTTAMLVSVQLGRVSFGITNDLVPLFPVNVLFMSMEGVYVALAMRSLDMDVSLVLKTIYVQDCLNQYGGEGRFLMAGTSRPLLNSSLNADTYAMMSHMLTHAFPYNEGLPGETDTKSTAKQTQNQTQSRKSSLNSKTLQSSPTSQASPTQSPLHRDSSQSLEKIDSAHDLVSVLVNPIVNHMQAEVLSNASVIDSAFLSCHVLLPQYTSPVYAFVSTLATAHFGKVAISVNRESIPPLMMFFAKQLLPNPNIVTAEDRQFGQVGLDFMQDIEWGDQDRSSSNPADHAQSRLSGEFDDNGDERGEKSQTDDKDTKTDANAVTIDPILGFDPNLLLSGVELAELEKQKGNGVNTAPSPSSMLQTGQTNAGFDVHRVLSLINAPNVALPHRLDAGYAKSPRKDHKNVKKGTTSPNSTKPPVLFDFNAPPEVNGMGDGDHQTSELDPVDQNLDHSEDDLELLKHINTFIDDLIAIDDNEYNLHYFGLIPAISPAYPPYMLENPDFIKLIAMFDQDEADVVIAEGEDVNVVRQQIKAEKIKLRNSILRGELTVLTTIADKYKAHKAALAALRMKILQSSPATTNLTSVLNPSLSVQNPVVFATLLQHVLPSTPISLTSTQLLHLHRFANTKTLLRLTRLKQRETELKSRPNGFLEKVEIQNRIRHYESLLNHRRTQLLQLRQFERKIRSLRRLGGVSSLLCTPPDALLTHPAKRVKDGGDGVPKLHKSGKATQRVVKNDSDDDFHDVAEDDDDVVTGLRNEIGAKDGEKTSSAAAETALTAPHVSRERVGIFCLPTDYSTTSIGLHEAIFNKDLTYLNKSCTPDDIYDTTDPLWDDDTFDIICPLIPASRLNLSTFEAAQKYSIVPFDVLARVTFGGIKITLTTQNIPMLEMDIENFKLGFGMHSYGMSVKLLLGAYSVRQPSENVQCSNLSPGVSGKQQNQLGHEKGSDMYRQLASVTQTFVNKAIDHQLACQHAQQEQHQSGQSSFNLHPSSTSTRIGGSLSGSRTGLSPSPPHLSPSSSTTSSNLHNSTYPAIPKDQRVQQILLDQMCDLRQYIEQHYKSMSVSAKNPNFATAPSKTPGGQGGSGIHTQRYQRYIYNRQNYRLFYPDIMFTAQSSSSSASHLQSLFQSQTSPESTPYGGKTGPNSSPSQQQSQQFQSQPPTPMTTIATNTDVSQSMLNLALFIRATESIVYDDTDEFDYYALAPVHNLLGLDDLALTLSNDMTSAPSSPSHGRPRAGGINTHNPFDPHNANTQNTDISTAGNANAQQFGMVGHKVFDTHRGSQMHGAQTGSLKGQQLLATLTRKQSLSSNSVTMVSPMAFGAASTTTDAPVNTAIVTSLPFNVPAFILASSEDELQNTSNTPRNNQHAPHSSKSAQTSPTLSLPPQTSRAMIQGKLIPTMIVHGHIQGVRLVVCYKVVDNLLKYVEGLDKCVNAIMSNNSYTNTMQLSRNKLRDAGDALRTASLLSHVSSIASLLSDGSNSSTDNDDNHDDEHEHDHANNNPPHGTKLPSNRRSNIHSQFHPDEDARDGKKSNKTSQKDDYVTDFDNVPRPSALDDHQGQYAHLVTPNLQIQNTMTVTRRAHVTPSLSLPVGSVYGSLRDDKFVSPHQIDHHGDATPHGRSPSQKTKNIKNAQSRQISLAALGQAQNLLNNATNPEKPRSFALLMEVDVKITNMALIIPVSSTSMEMIAISLDTLAISSSSHLTQDYSTSKSLEGATFFATSTNANTAKDNTANRAQQNYAKNMLSQLLTQQATLQRQSSLSKVAAHKGSMSSPHSVVSTLQRQNSLIRENSLISSTLPRNNSLSITQGSKLGQSPAGLDAWSQNVNLFKSTSTLGLLDGDDDEFFDAEELSESNAGNLQLLLDTIESDQPFGSLSSALPTTLLTTSSIPQDTSVFYQIAQHTEQAKADTMLAIGPPSQSYEYRNIQIDFAVSLTGISITTLLLVTPEGIREQTAAPRFESILTPEDQLMMSNTPSTSNPQTTQSSAQSTPVPAHSVLPSFKAALGIDQNAATDPLRTTTSFTGAAQIAQGGQNAQKWSKSRKSNTPMLKMLDLLAIGDISINATHFSYVPFIIITPPTKGELEKARNGKKSDVLQNTSPLSTERAEYALFHTAHTFFPQLTLPDWAVSMVLDNVDLTLSQSQLSLLLSLISTHSVFPGNLGEKSILNFPPYQPATASNTDTSVSLQQIQFYSPLVRHVPLDLLRNALRLLNQVQDSTLTDGLSSGQKITMEQTQLLLQALSQQNFASKIQHVREVAASTNSSMGGGKNTAKANSIADMLAGKTNNNINSRLSRLQTNRQSRLSMGSKGDYNPKFDSWGTHGKDLEEVMHSAQMRKDGEIHHPGGASAGPKKGLSVSFSMDINRCSLQVITNPTVEESPSMAFLIGIKVRLNMLGDGTIAVTTTFDDICVVNAALPTTNPTLLKPIIRTLPVSTAIIKPFSCVTSVSITPNTFNHAELLSPLPKLYTPPQSTHRYKQLRKLFHQPTRSPGQVSPQVINVSCVVTNISVKISYTDYEMLMDILGTLTASQADDFHIHPPQPQVNANVSRNDHMTYDSQDLVAQSQSTTTPFNSTPDTPTNTTNTLGGDKFGPNNNPDFQNATNTPSHPSQLPQLLYSMGDLAVSFILPNCNILLVNDSPGFPLPFMRINITDISSTVTSFAHRRDILLKSAVSIDYHNGTLVAWEPLLEPSKYAISVRQSITHPMSIVIKSLGKVDLNVTRTMMEGLAQSLSLLASAQQAQNRKLQAQLAQLSGEQLEADQDDDFTSNLNNLAGIAGNGGLPSLDRPQSNDHGTDMSNPVSPRSPTNMSDNDQTTTTSAQSANTALSFHHAYAHKRLLVDPVTVKHVINRKLNNLHHSKNFSFFKLDNNTEFNLYYSFGAQSVATDVMDEHGGTSINQMTRNHTPKLQDSKLVQTTTLLSILDVENSVYDQLSALSQTAKGLVLQLRHIEHGGYLPSSPHYHAYKRYYDGQIAQQRAAAQSDPKFDANTLPQLPTTLTKGQKMRLIKFNVLFASWSARMAHSLVAFDDLDDKSEKTPKNQNDQNDEKLTQNIVAKGAEKRSPKISKFANSPSDQRTLPSLTSAPLFFNNDFQDNMTIDSLLRTQHKQAVSLMALSSSSIFVQGISAAGTEVQKQNGQRNGFAMSRSQQFNKATTKLLSLQVDGYKPIHNIQVETVGCQSFVLMPGPVGRVVDSRESDSDGDGDDDDGTTTTHQNSSKPSQTFDSAAAPLEPLAVLIDVNIVQGIKVISVRSARAMVNMLDVPIEIAYGYGLNQSTIALPGETFYFPLATQKTNTNNQIDQTETSVKKGDKNEKGLGNDTNSSSSRPAYDLSPSFVSIRPVSFTQTPSTLSTRSVGRSMTQGIDRFINSAHKLKNLQRNTQKSDKPPKTPTNHTIGTGDDDSDGHSLDLSGSFQQNTRLSSHMHQFSEMASHIHSDYKLSYPLDLNTLINGAFLLSEASLDQQYTTNINPNGAQRSQNATKNDQNDKKSKKDPKDVKTGHREENQPKRADFIALIHRWRQNGLTYWALCPPISVTNLLSERAVLTLSTKPRVFGEKKNKKAAFATVLHDNGHDSIANVAPTHSVRFYGSVPSAARNPLDYNPTASQHDHNLATKNGKGAFRVFSQKFSTDDNAPNKIKLYLSIAIPSLSLVTKEAVCISTANSSCSYLYFDLVHRAALDNHLQNPKKYTSDLRTLTVHCEVTSSHFLLHTKTLQSVHVPQISTAQYQFNQLWTQQSQNSLISVAKSDISTQIIPSTHNLPSVFNSGLKLVLYTPYWLFDTTNLGLVISENSKISDLKHLTPTQYDSANNALMHDQNDLEMLAKLRLYQSSCEDSLQDQLNSEYTRAAAMGASMSFFNPATTMIDGQFKEDRDDTRSNYSFICPKTGSVAQVANPSATLNSDPQLGFNVAQKSLSLDPPRQSTRDSAHTSFLSQFHPSATSDPDSTHQNQQIIQNINQTCYKKATMFSNLHHQQVASLHVSARLTKPAHLVVSQQTMYPPQCSDHLNKGTELEFLSEPSTQLVSLDSVGVSTVLEFKGLETHQLMISGKKDKIMYSVGMLVRNGQDLFKRTKSVYFSPRIVIVNKLPLPIIIRQHCLDDLAQLKTQSSTINTRFNALSDSNDNTTMHNLSQSNMENQVVDSGPGGAGRTGAMLNELDPLYLEGRYHATACFSDRTERFVPPEQIEPYHWGHSKEERLISFKLLTNSDPFKNVIESEAKSVFSKSLTNLRPKVAHQYDIDQMGAVGCDNNVNFNTNSLPHMNTANGLQSGETATIFDQIDVAALSSPNVPSSAFVLQTDNHSVISAIPSTSVTAQNANATSTQLVEGKKNQHKGLDRNDVKNQKSAKTGQTQTAQPVAQAPWDEGIWGWSGYINPDQLGDHTLVVRNPITGKSFIIKIRVILTAPDIRNGAGSTVTVVFEAQDLVFPQYRIENKTCSDTIRIAQGGCQEWTTLRPYDSTVYTWDQPLLDSILQVDVTSGTNTVHCEYNIDELGPKGTITVPGETSHVLNLLTGPAGQDSGQLFDTEAQYDPAGAKKKHKRSKKQQKADKVAESILYHQQGGVNPILNNQSKRNTHTLFVYVRNEGPTRVFVVSDFPSTNNEVDLLTSQLLNTSGTKVAMDAIYDQYKIGTRGVEIGALLHKWSQLKHLTGSIVPKQLQYGNTKQIVQHNHDKNQLVQNDGNMVQNGPQNAASFDPLEESDFPGPHGIDLVDRALLSMAQTYESPYSDDFCHSIAVLGSSSRKSPSADSIRKVMAAKQFGYLDWLENDQTTQQINRLSELFPGFDIWDTTLCDLDIEMLSNEKHGSAGAVSQAQLKGIATNDQQTKILNAVSSAQSSEAELSSSAQVGADVLPLTANELVDLVKVRAQTIKSMVVKYNNVQYQTSIVSTLAKYTLALHNGTKGHLTDLTGVLTPDENSLISHLKDDVAYLAVRAVEARWLTPASISGLSDCYAMITFNNQTYKTQVVQKTLNPFWESEMFFRIDGNLLKELRIFQQLYLQEQLHDKDNTNITLPRSPLNSLNLRIALFHENFLLQDTFLGGIILSSLDCVLVSQFSHEYQQLLAAQTAQAQGLSMLNNTSPVLMLNRWFKLHALRHNKLLHGQAQLSFGFVPNELMKQRLILYELEQDLLDHVLLLARLTLKYRKQLQSIDVGVLDLNTLQILPQLRIPLQEHFVAMIKGKERHPPKGTTKKKPFKQKKSSSSQFKTHVTMTSIGPIRYPTPPFFELFKKYPELLKHFNKKMAEQKIDPNAPQNQPHQATSTTTQHSAETQSRRNSKLHNAPQYRNSTDPQNPPPHTSKPAPFRLDKTTDPLGILAKNPLVWQGEALRAKNLPQFVPLSLSESQTTSVLTELATTAINHYDDLVESQKEVTVCVNVEEIAIDPKHVFDCLLKEDKLLPQWIPKKIVGVVQCNGHVSKIDLFDVHIPETSLFSPISNSSLQEPPMTPNTMAKTVEQIELILPDDPNSPSCTRNDNGDQSGAKNDNLVAKDGQKSSQTSPSGLSRDLANSPQRSPKQARDQRNPVIPDSPGMPAHTTFQIHFVEDESSKPNQNAQINQNNPTIAPINADNDMIVEHELPYTQLLAEETQKWLEIYGIQLRPNLGPSQGALTVVPSYDPDDENSGAQHGQKTAENNTNPEYSRSMSMLPSSLSGLSALTQKPLNISLNKVAGAQEMLTFTLPLSLIKSYVAALNNPHIDTLHLSSSDIPALTMTVMVEIEQDQSYIASTSSSSSSSTSSAQPFQPHANDKTTTTNSSRTDSTAANHAHGDSGPDVLNSIGFYSTLKAAVHLADIDVPLVDLQYIDIYDPEANQLKTIYDPVSFLPYQIDSLGRHADLLKLESHYYFARRQRFYQCGPHVAESDAIFSLLDRFTPRVLKPPTPISNLSESEVLAAKNVYSTENAHVLTAYLYQNHLDSQLANYLEFEEEVAEFHAIRQEQLRLIDLKRKIKDGTATPASSSSSGVESLNISPTARPDQIIIGINADEYPLLTRVPLSPVRVTIKAHIQTSKPLIERPQMQVQVDVPHFGLSLVDSTLGKANELLYISSTGLQIELEDSLSQRAIELKLKGFQVDQCIDFSTSSIKEAARDADKIIFGPSEASLQSGQPFVHISLNQTKTPLGYPVQVFKYATILIQEMNVRVEEALLYHLLRFSNDILPALSSSTNATDTNLAALVVDERILYQPQNISSTALFYFTVLHIQPISIYLTFKVSPDIRSAQDDLKFNPIQALLKAAGGILGNIDAAPICMQSLLIKDAAGDISTLIYPIVQFYVAQGIREGYKVLGSFEFLGNPVSLVSGVGSGVKDFFYEPAQGLVSSPKDFGTGLVKGSASLVRSLTTGLFGAASKVTGSIGKGLSTLTMDSNFQAQRRARHSKKVKHAGQGLLQGSKALSYGIFAGISGIVMNPLEGARRGGASGFFVGLATGITGVVTKTASGALDLLSLTLQGFGNTFKLFDDDVEPARARFPRFISTYGSMKNYDVSFAVGHFMLQAIPQPNLETKAKQILTTITGLGGNQSNFQREDEITMSNVLHHLGKEVFYDVDVNLESSTSTNKLSSSLVELEALLGNTAYRAVLEQQYNQFNSDGRNDQAGPPEGKEHKQITDISRAIDERLRFIDSTSPEDLVTCYVINNVTDTNGQAASNDNTGLHPSAVVVAVTTKRIIAATVHDIVQASIEGGTIPDNKVTFNLYLDRLVDVYCVLPDDKPVTNETNPRLLAQQTTSVSLLSKTQKDKKDKHTALKKGIHVPHQSTAYLCITSSMNYEDDDQHLKTFRIPIQNTFECQVTTLSIQSYLSRPIILSARFGGQDISQTLASQFYKVPATPNTLFALSNKSADFYESLILGAQKPTTFPIPENKEAYYYPPIDQINQFLTQYHMSAPTKVVSTTITPDPLNPRKLHNTIRTFDPLTHGRLPLVYSHTNAMSRSNQSNKQTLFAPAHFSVVAPPSNPSQQLSLYSFPSTTLRSSPAFLALKKPTTLHRAVWFRQITTDPLALKYQSEREQEINKLKAKVLSVTYTIGTHVVTKEYTTYEESIVIL